MSFLKHGFAAALLCLLFLQATACLTPKVQDAALYPPALAAWLFIEVDLEFGYADAIAANELTQADAVTLRVAGNALQVALEKKSKYELRLAPWFQMRPYADRGVDARMRRGEIGPGGAETAHETIRQFDDAMNTLRGLSQ